MSKVSKKTTRGPLSDKQKDFIDKNRDRMTAEQIANRLGRPTSTVHKYMATLVTGTKPLRKEMLLAEELEKRPEWEQFRLQFTGKELDHFRYRYVQLMGQFRDDILPTEEMQIFQLITLDIMIQRVLKEHREMIERQEVLQTSKDEIFDEIKGGKLDRKNNVTSIETKQAEVSEQIKYLAQRHDSYLTRQSMMLKELKATRDQRVKISEDSRKSFLNYLRALGEEETRYREGRDMELMRLAADNEKKRLSAPHKYEDGVVDQPLLTPETVLSGNFSPPSPSNPSDRLPVPGISLPEDVKEGFEEGVEETAEETAEESIEEGVEKSVEDNVEEDINSEITCEYTDDQNSE